MSLTILHNWAVVSLFKVSFGSPSKCANRHQSAIHQANKMGKNTREGAACTITHL